jgi:DNA replicative helicase MCM subunit Mcm2 (Cdc46/Mcm family)
MIYVAALRAKHLDKQIEVTGRVIEISEVRPQATSAKFKCIKCGQILVVEQEERKLLEPSRCPCGHDGEFKLLSKEMTDAQRVLLQQENSILNVFLRGKLCAVERQKIIIEGNNIFVKGILKEVPVALDDGTISTRFDLALEASEIRKA